MGIYVSFQNGRTIYIPPSASLLAVVRAVLTTDDPAYSASLSDPRRD